MPRDSWELCSDGIGGWHPPMVTKAPLLCLQSLSQVCVHPQSPPTLAEAVLRAPGSLKLCVCGVSVKTPRAGSPCPSRAGLCGVGFFSFKFLGERGYFE